MGSTVLAAALLALSTTPDPVPEARYMFLPEAVATADVIAVVSISKSTNIARRWSGDPTKRIGAWGYAQKNTFRFVEMIKRAPFVSMTEADQTLWSESDFICASITCEPGDYLVFLGWVAPGEWVTVNYQMGALRTEEGTLDWPYTEAPRDETGAGPNFGAAAPRTIAQAKVEIAASFCGGEPFHLSVQVRKAHENDLTRWVPEHSHQALTLHLKKNPGRNRPVGKWPRSMRAWIATEKVERAWYEALLENGGELRVTAQWKEGNLLITEID